MSIYTNAVIAHAAGVPQDNVAKNWPIIERALDAEGLGDPTMQRYAIATVAVEVSRFAPMDEGRSRYNTSLGGAPFDLYDKRRDLGNILPGDGARYKGRGYIQITGRENYAKYGAEIGVNLIDCPDDANRPEVAAAILARYLKKNETRIRRAIRQGNLADARRVVNGGTNGLTRFMQVWKGLGG